jgi:CrcB protein
MIRLLMLTAIGGAFGSISRWGCTLFAQRLLPSSWPWGTFMSNVLGCFVAGLLAGWFAKMPEQNGPMKQLLLIGFCGGFTTFSSFSLDTIRMLQQGQMLQAMTYAGSSFLLSLFALALGLQFFR